MMWATSKHILQIKNRRHFSHTRDLFTAIQTIRFNFIQRNKEFCMYLSTARRWVAFHWWRFMSNARCTERRFCCSIHCTAWCTIRSHSIHSWCRWIGVSAAVAAGRPGGSFGFFKFLCKLIAESKGGIKNSKFIKIAQMASSNKIKFQTMQTWQRKLSLYKSSDPQLPEFIPVSVGWSD